MQRLYISSGSEPLAFYFKGALNMLMYHRRSSFCLFIPFRITVY